MADKKVNVKLHGAAEALLASEQLDVTVARATPSEIIKAVAAANPLLKRQLVRGDGSPRQSTRILIDGAPPSSLDDVIPDAAEILLSASVPCDG